MKQYTFHTFNIYKRKKGKKKLLSITHDQLIISSIFGTKKKVTPINNVIEVLYKEVDHRHVIEIVALMTVSRAFVHRDYETVMACVVMIKENVENLRFKMKSFLMDRVFSEQQLEIKQLIRQPDREVKRVINRNQCETSAPSDDETSSIWDSCNLVDFKRIQVIGKGSFAMVYLCQHVRAEKYYAMKVIDKKKIKKSHSEIRTMNERIILENIDHPFIVKVYSAFSTKRSLYLILDFINGGELFHHLELVDKFPEERAVFHAAEILCALEYLHCQDIIYRDLKPENVLIGSNGHIMLTDFGMARILRDGDVAMSVCGTKEYLAPEILTGGGYTKSVDIWAFGMLMYEMLSGRPAFDSEHGDVKDQIKNNNLDMPAYFSDEAIDLLKNLLEKDITKRLTDFTKIKNHRLFRHTDWNNLQFQIPPYIPEIDADSDVQMIATEYLQMTVSLSLEPSTASTENFKGYPF